MIYTFYRQEDMRIVEDGFAEQGRDIPFHIYVLFLQIRLWRPIVTLNSSVHLLGIMYLVASLLTFRR
jgi:hypothetical protein